MEYTKAWTGERFADGRPRVPDSWLKRAKDMSSEEVIVPGGRGGGPPNIAGYAQFDGDFKVLHPELKMAGRVVTAMYMPARPDIDTIMLGKFREKGIMLNNQWPMDQLQPGDVLVIDMYGKVEGGGIVGDNLYYYIMKATKGGGLVINGSLRDMEGISEIKMPGYVRSVTPTWFGGSTLYGYNVPVRMGNAVVMPGDLAIGDREGVSFVPPSLAESILDKADETHIHDEWTKMKFDQGKYKSMEIYPSPRGRRHAQGVSGVSEKETGRAEGRARGRGQEVSASFQIRPNFATASLMEWNFSMRGMVECSWKSSS